MGFNLVVSNTSYGPVAFGRLVIDLAVLPVLRAVFSMALPGLPGRVTHHVKFFLLLAILLLVYAVGKTFHLCTLVVVLGFGVFLANAAYLPVAWFRKHFLYSGFKGESTHCTRHPGRGTGKAATWPVNEPRAPVGPPLIVALGFATGSRPGSSHCPDSTWNGFAPAR